MAIAQWRDEYCTGYEIIDIQHQTLFKIVNQIHAEILKNSQNQALIRTQLEAFHQQAIEHFDLEESLMLEQDYFNYEIHRQIHKALCAKVKSLLNKLDQGTEAFPHKVTSVLTDWMIHHIRGEDQQMIQFFRAKNIV